MSRLEKTKQLEEQIAEATEDLSRQLQLGHTEDFIELLEFYGNFRHYSLSNILLILIQNRDATRCAGFKVWEKLGYKVRKGEKALWILGPRFKKMENPNTGLLEEALVGWLALPVFDVSQLEGSVELPSERHPLEGDWLALYELTKDRVISTGVEFIEEPLVNGVLGMSMEGKIVVDSRQSDSDKCLVAWHEWAHQMANHHNRHDETTKIQRELVAESVSFIVARLFGLDNPFSRNYLINWKGTTESLHSNLSEIHSLVKRIAGLLSQRSDSNLLANSL